MPKPSLFVDSSALFAGVVSSSGAARALLLLAESQQITITVSEQVIVETERAVARKVPQALRYFRETLRATRLHIVPDPPREQIDAHADIIRHQADVPIVVAAIRAGVDYLVTHNRRHFLDDAGVATRSGLSIGAPGEALAWVRAHLSQAAARASAPRS